MTKESYLGVRVRTRLESGPVGPYVHRLAETLHREGYRPARIDRYLRAADQFGQWLCGVNLTLAEVNDAVVERYIAGLGRRPCSTRPQGRLPEAAFGLRPLLQVLQEAGVIVQSSKPVPPGPCDPWLNAFVNYLDAVIGLSAGARRTYLRYARAFLKHRFGSEVPDLTSLTADDVCEFVRKEAAKLTPSASRAPVTSLRAFLRFLLTQNVIKPGLDGAVPTVRQWKLASLPKHLSDDELARLFYACDRTTPVGYRDRAVLMLLARLGLRAGEIQHLHLEDIDWSEGRILIRAGKSRRERMLPLSQEVGDALVTYLEKGRPQSHHRTVFLRCRPPYRPLKDSSFVTAIAKTYMKRTGLETSGRGAHTLRHTTATSMVCHGVSFKEVADILGHQSLVTTAIYAKLDVARLANVALPWPGGEQ